MDNSISYYVDERQQKRFAMKLKKYICIQNFLIEASKSESDLIKSCNIHKTGRKTIINVSFKVPSTNHVVKLIIFDTQLLPISKNI